MDTQGRLFVFDPARDALIATPIDRARGAVQVWREDREGNVWIGTWGNGVSRLDRAATRLHTLGRRADAPGRSIAGNVRSIKEAPDGRVWVALDDTLARYDPASGRVENFALEAYGLHRDTEGRLWAAGQTTLQQIDEQGRIRRRIPFGTVPSEEAKLNVTPRLTQIVEGRPGALWIGTYGRGLFEVDTRSGRMRHFTHNPADPTSLSENFPMALAWDARDSTLWVGTNNGGVNHLDPRTGRAVRYGTAPSSPLNSVQSVHIDRAGRLWMGSYFDGLHLFDRRTGRTRRYSVEEGLPDPTVNTIGEDRRGDLWVGTESGVSRLDLARGTFRTFGRADGLTMSDFRNTSLFTADGKAYFGGVSGLTVFTPAALRDSPDQPPVVLTALRVLDRLLTPGPDSPLTTAITDARRVTLPHNENDLTFEYAALAFDRNALVRYAYQLEGYDQDWSAPTADRAARYTNLPPGRYTFRVKSANADGVWGKSGATLVVVIRPPWWRTWWAYTLYALMALIALWWLVRAVRHRARLRERERVREERERAKDRELAQAKEIEVAYTQLKGAQAQLVQQEKLASLGALTAGIAHEIKNPLNFVNNFAQLSEELVAEIEHERSAKPDLRVDEVDDLLADLKSNAARIREHGQRADSIVKNMLAHSRGGAGVRESVDVNALLDEYTSLAFHGMRAQRPDFTCTVERDFDAAAGSVEAVPQDLSRVVLNLVGNALYAVAQRHTGDGAPDGPSPTVRVSTHAAEGSVKVRVWDNGGGIPEAVRAKIFEPFFTTKPTGEGTGLGLSLSHDIIQAHGGTLALETEAGDWTCFTVRLPTERTGRTDLKGLEDL